jgi:NADH-quinone oxidoreductase subunit L
MVAAGVYLVARLFPIYEATPVIMTLIAAVGLTTALVGALMAMVQTDLKRVLAYSTISHLGFMMVALGAGAMGVAMFHLLAHAFAKAALFLGAGAVTHATHLTDIRQMGGLRKKMPVTFIAFTVAALSLAGIPPLAGFFTKDEILLAVFDGHLNPVFLFGVFVAVAISALYTGRLLILMFFGRPRDAHAFEHAHEAPPLLLGPVAVLASLGAVLGLLAFAWTSKYQGFSWYLSAGAEHGFGFETWISIVAIALVLGALYLTWDLYAATPARRERGATGDARETPRPGSRAAARAARQAGARQASLGQAAPTFLERTRASLAPVQRALEDKLYFDAAYQWCVDRVMVTVAQVIGLFDRAVVNDRGIEGNSTVVRDAGGVLRYLQSGMVYNYALGIVVGALVVAVLWWVVRA